MTRPAACGIGRLVVELHAQEQRAPVAEYRIRHSLGTGRREFGCEAVGVLFREREVIVVVQDVLSVDRETQEFVVLIANTGDPSLEVKRVDIYMSVRLEPLEHSEQC